MPQTLNVGASVYAGEVVRLAYAPTKNRGGGKIDRIPAPIDGVYKVTVQSHHVLTGQRAPIGLRAVVNGATIYDAATDDDGIHTITVAARTLSPLGPRELTIDLVFPSLSIPEVRVSIAVELVGATGGVKYQPTKSGLNFRLKQGARPVTQQPTTPTPTEEAPDGLIETAEVLTAEEVAAGK